MQVNRIQTSNHNTSFARIRPHFSSSTRISSSETKKILEKCSTMGKDAKKILKKSLINAMNQN